MTVLWRTKDPSSQGEGIQNSAILLKHVSKKSALGHTKCLIGGLEFITALLSSEKVQINKSLWFSLIIFLTAVNRSSVRVSKTGN